MNIDGQGSNPESQSYGNNDDIHIQENLSPNNCGNNVENVRHSKADVRAVIIIMCQRQILKKISGQKKTMSNKLMMNKAVMKTLVNTLHQ